MQASSNHISVTNQSTLTTPTLSPFHEEILTILFQSACHINALLLDGKLTPSQLLAFASDPAVKQVLAAWESLQELHQRMLGRQAQITAAAHLDGAISDAHPTPEARRAATTLTKLTTHMIAPRAPRRPNASPAPLLRKNQSLIHPHFTFLSHPKAVTSPASAKDHPCPTPIPISPPPPPNPSQAARSRCSPPTALNRSS